MAELSFERTVTAIKRYNDLIDEVYGDPSMRVGGSKTHGWNLRDLVSEIQYHLDNHYEYGHAFYCELHDVEDYEPDDRDYKMAVEQRKRALQRIAKYKRFIKAYEPFIKDMKCKERHCSKYDK